MLTDGNKGSTSFLNWKQLEDLKNHITENTYMDSKGIVVWVETEFKIRYSCSSINELLKRLGFVYKKPVSTPVKGDFLLFGKT